jgi:nitrous oxidase accessory protein NosD
MRSPLAALAAVALFLIALSGCSHGPADTVRPAGDGPVVITVPGDAQTISEAVAAAKPGDLVLVGPGVYHETVTVATPRITLRGTDRSAVVIDGELSRANDIVVTAPGVTVQNLTVRNATLNGVLIRGMSTGAASSSSGYATTSAVAAALVGYHVDHVTSYNNGLYGIYAFNSQYGLIENSYTSGMADSGIYVGQCDPCHTVVKNNIAERNAVGYEGTNASTEMYVVGNRLVGNRVGLTTDSDYKEALVPQKDSVVAGNVVAANSRADTPEQADGGFGIGVGVAGGTDNLITRNLIVANPVAGLVLTSHDDLAPIGNRIVGNSFTRNGVDVVYAATAQAPGSKNCLADNSLTTTEPASLATTMSCPGGATSTTGAAMPAMNAPPGIAFSQVAVPPTQPSLPSPSAPPAAWTTDAVPHIDVDALTTPASSLLAEHSAITW